jgi:hypothetical protein
MKMKLIMTLAVGVAVAALTNGCTTATRGTAASLPVINANMDKNDYEVGPPTEGTSKVTSVLLGLVKVFDGNKVKVLGIPFYEVQRASPGLFDVTITGFVRDWVNGSMEAKDRAYFKALETTPDADTIVPKAYVTSYTGIPILFTSTEVTFQGKSLKYKTHN